MRRMELEPFIPCWKKTPRALKIHEQQQRKDIRDTPERRTDAELAFFKDPVEAAAFFCLVDLVMRASDKNSPGLSSTPLLSRQKPIIVDLPVGQRPRNYRERSRGLLLQQECGYRGGQSPPHEKNLNSGHCC